MLKHKSYMKSNMKPIKYNSCTKFSIDTQFNVP